jgi:4-amino-4-deoxy-L-arabinose transferase-like glycosyltransferase
MKKLSNSTLITLIILLVSNFILWTNAINAPVYFIDEFLYTSRSWEIKQLITFQNNPYTPIFDHPSLGWILMGIFGRFFQGLPWIYRTRIFVSLISSIELILIYFICKKYFSKKVAIISISIFGLNPNIITLKRMVLLDNIGMIFVLLALYFIYNRNKDNSNSNSINEIKKEKKLDKINGTNIIDIKKFILSGFLIGCSILVKLTFIIFIPAFIVFYISRERNILFFLEKSIFVEHFKLWMKWFFSLIIPILLYIVIISILGYLDEFIWYLKWQFERKAFEDSFLNNFFDYWIFFFPFFLIISIIFALIFFILGLIFLIRNIKSINNNYNKNINDDVNELDFKMSFTERNLFGLSSFIIGFFLFLIRGGVVYFFYIIPIFPLASMLIALVLDHLFSIASKKNKLMDIMNDKISKSKYFGKIKYSKSSIFAILIIIFVLCIPLNYKELFKNQNDELFIALDWVNNNVPKNSTIIVNDFFIAELREEGFEFVQFSWLLNPDDLENDWKNIDYFIAETLQDVKINFTENAILNSIPIKTFDFETYRVNSVTIYKVIK